MRSDDNAGIAYQIVPHDQGTADVRQSTVVRTWGTKTFHKVPSEISYSATLEQNRQWGFDIDPGAQRMIWTKMELDQSDTIQELKWIKEALIGMRNLDLDAIRGENGLPSYPAKEPVDIVADYLSHLREQLLEELEDEERLGRAVLFSIVTDLVVTVPAVR